MMIAASFTAWQILRSKGLKKKWSEWLKINGLDIANGKKVDKNERDEIIKNATSLFQKIGKGK